MEGLQPSGLPSAVPHQTLCWKHRMRFNCHLHQMARVCELTVYVIHRVNGRTGCMQLYLTRWHVPRLMLAVLNFLNIRVRSCKDASVWSLSVLDIVFHIHEFWTFSWLSAVFKNKFENMDQSTHSSCWLEWEHRSCHVKSIYGIICNVQWFINSVSYRFAYGKMSVRGSVGRASQKTQTNRIHLGTGSKLSKPLKSYAPELINQFLLWMPSCLSLAGLYAYYANWVGLHKFEIRKATSPTCDRMAVSVYNFDERMKQNDPSGNEKTVRKNSMWQPGLQVYVGRSNSLQACLYILNNNFILHFITP